jgi:hypothetical protein
MNSTGKLKITFYSSDFCLSVGGFFFSLCLHKCGSSLLYLYLHVSQEQNMWWIPQKNKGSTFSSPSALQLPSHQVRHKPKKSTQSSTRYKVTMYEQNSTNVLMVYWVTGYCHASVLQPQDYRTCKMSIQLPRHLKNAQVCLWLQTSFP